MKGKHNFYNKHIYAAYRGDDYVMEGTLEELCKALGRTRRNLMWCLAPSSKKRQARQKMTKRRLTLVRVDDDDDVSESELEAVARPWRPGVSDGVFNGGGRARADFVIRRIVESGKKGIDNTPPDVI